MLLFVAWKNKIARQKDKPVILLLDGHSSHLSLEALFTAAKNRIIVLCLPSHTTSVLQPNDRMVNRQFKLNLDGIVAEQAAVSVTIDDWDVSFHSFSALKNDNMAKAIVQSRTQTSLFPCERKKVVDEVKKYQVAQKKKEDTERLEKLRDLLEVREAKRRKVVDEKEK
mmetsp:Transcript_33747/g.46172  ORF Transcript_33747/g.46172 Transcript_33747/m.46172 type:complete len:168 (-) Transcript_33747:415-918(-)